MRRKSLFLVLSLILVNTLPLFSDQKVRIAVLGFEAPDEIKAFRDRLDQAVLNALKGQADVVIIPSSELASTRGSLAALYPNDPEGLSRALSRALKARYLVQGSITPQVNRYAVRASVYHGAKEQFFSPIQRENRRDLEDLLVGEIVNLVVSQVKADLAQGQTRLIETATTLSESLDDEPSLQLEDSLPLSGRSLTLDTIFYGGLGLPFFDNDLTLSLGIDFIFNIEKTYSALGFGFALFNAQAVDINLFYEVHYFENNYHDNWQIYLRTGPGLTYPIAESAEFSFKLDTSLGVRLSLSYFVFDVGLGINYYYNQRCALYLKAGGGFHF